METTKTAHHRIEFTRRLMATTAERHTPVLAGRTVELLAPAADGVVVDATLGMGGHSAALLTAYPQLRVIGIDRDEEALALATARLAPFAERFSAIHATYDAVGELGPVDGVLMDLGVSSLQLDETYRGFSYAHDAPLDMRMDPTTGASAADLLANASEAELARILSRYGEERFAPRIARNIVERRATAPLTHTFELAELVRQSIPAAARRTGGNPAKRTFQALRVAVNNELDILERAVPAALEALTPGGRLVVLSYQSLEDRIVKRALAAVATVHVLPGLPVEPPPPGYRLITRGAERASSEEIAANPRAASVRLRAAERTSR